MSGSPYENLTVGVLALQGAFREHCLVLQRCGAGCREVRRRRELEGLDALIIPGGESTTIGKLMISYRLLEAVKALGSEGLPIFGTCAGLVMLAREVCEKSQPLLSLMDIKVRRNAFGRQVKSFEAPLQIPALDGIAGEASGSVDNKTFPGIFIRAPWIESAANSVEVLCSHDGHGVAARQGNLLATAFHPELTNDNRLHLLFLEMVKLAGTRAGR